MTPSVCEFCLTDRMDKDRATFKSLIKDKESSNDFCRVYNCLLSQVGDKCKQLNKWKMRNKIL